MIVTEMEKLKSKDEDFGNTFTGLCAVPEPGGKYCGWKTASLIDEKTATKSLQEHADKAHLGHPAPIGYVNLTSIIDRLEL